MYYLGFLYFIKEVVCLHNKDMILPLSNIRMDTTSEHMLTYASKENNCACPSYLKFLNNNSMHAPLVLS